MKGLALAAAIFASPLAAQAPLEFKGVPLGASVAELSSALPGINCQESVCTVFPEVEATRQCRPSDPYRGTCKRHVMESYSWGGVFAHSYGITLENGRVTSVLITFKQGDFRPIAEGLIEKYGRPVSDRTSSVQNRMGASFGNRQLVWRRADGGILATERTGSVDESSVLITTHEATATTERAYKDRGKEVAKKL